MRLHTPFKDLGYRPDVSAATIVSTNFLRWLTIMDVRPKPASAGAIDVNAMECHRSSFGKKVAVIVDSFEVSIEHPLNLLGRSSMWSSYKHHNCLK